MEPKSCIRVLLVAGMFAAAPVHAQVTGIVTKSTSTTTLVSKTGISFSLQFDGTDVGFESGYDALGVGSVFSATSQLEPDYIAFRNGNVSSGRYAMTTSHTIVDISFTNDGTEAVRPLLVSNILPAGLGLFIDGSQCFNRLTSCGASIPATNPATFQDFLPSGAGGPANSLAGALFDFKITGGGDTLYDLSGGVTLVRDLATQTNQLITNLAAAQAALDGFRIASPTGSDQEYSAQWDVTPISVDFGLGTLLQPGESSTLRYETTVTTFAQVDCLTTPADACLIAYSAFGDPMGRGGGINPTFARFASLAAPSLIREFVPSEDDLLQFGNFKFNKPTFKDGILSFELQSEPVPEPATWALMIAGFAFAGVCMRRRSSAHFVRVG